MGIGTVDGVHHVIEQSDHSPTYPRHGTFLSHPAWPLVLGLWKKWSDWYGGKDHVVNLVYFFIQVVAVDRRGQIGGPGPTCVPLPPSELDESRSSLERPT